MFTVVHETNNQCFCSKPFINNCTIDVALFNNVPFLYKTQASIQLHYRTPQNSKSVSSV